MIEQIREEWNVQNENSEVDDRLRLLVVKVDQWDLTSHNSHWIENQESIVSQECEEFAVLADIVLIPDHFGAAPSHKHQIVPDLQGRLLWKDAQHNKDARSNLKNCCNQIAAY